MHDVSGLFVDIGKYVTGEPECFITLDPIEMQERPFVHLYIGHKGSSSGVSSSEITEYARRMSILYNALIASGVNVALTYAKFSDISATYIELSDGSYRVPIQTIYSILHPSFFRRIIFRLIERSRLLTPGYGHGACVSDLPVIGLYESKSGGSDREFVESFFKKNGLILEGGN